MMGKWVELFKAGRQTDSAGNVRDWTERDLDSIVAKYNGQTDHEAPIVVGHPDHNSPAFGWVEKLKRDGKLLMGMFKEVMPEFDAAVQAGTYKKRSISLYPDLTLRHVGFLGGMPPAVKGLANIAFKSGEASLTYEFCDERMNTMGRIIMRIRDYLVGKEGSEKADAIISSWDVQDLLTPPPEQESMPATSYHEENEMKQEEVKALIDDALKGQATAFSEQLKAITEENKALKTDLATLITGQATQTASAQQREFGEFLQTEAMQRRIPESQRAATVAHLMTLTAAPALEFGEGAQKKTVSAVEDYKTRLQALPEVVQFSEQATKDRLGALTSGGMDAQTLAGKAVEFQESEARSGRTISMTQAVNHVKKGGK
jgi:hypothetical protein